MSKMKKIESIKENPTKNLKVLSGKFKGLKLYSILDSATTRPSKAILKESFFNTLRDEIFDSIFIEGFSGSGSIGIEAISLGARHIEFIELDSSAINILKKNLALIEKFNPSFKITQNDSFKILPNIIENLTHRTILYLDPPFLIRENYADIYKRCANLIENINNKNVTIIAIEHISSYDFPDILGKFEKLKTKAFGKSALTYFIQGEENG